MINAMLHLRNWLMQHNIDPSSVACVTVEFTGPDRAELASRILVQESGLPSRYIGAGAVERIADIPIKIVGRAL